MQVALQQERLVLDAVGAEDEIGERLVRDVRWPALPDWKMSTVAVAYLGAVFLSPEKVRSTRIPVAVSWFGPPPLGRLTNGGAPTSLPITCPRVKKQIRLHVDDFQLGARAWPASADKRGGRDGEAFHRRPPNLYKSRLSDDNCMKKTPVRVARGRGSLLRSGSAAAVAVASAASGTC